MLQNNLRGRELLFRNIKATFYISKQHFSTSSKTHTLFLKSIIYISLEDKFNYGNHFTITIEIHSLYVFYYKNHFATTITVEVTIGKNSIIKSVL